MFNAIAGSLIILGTTQFAFGAALGDLPPQSEDIQLTDVVKNPDGESNRKMNFEEAATYCEAAGLRVPTIHELVSYALNRGAKGTLKREDLHVVLGLLVRPDYSGFIEGTYGYQDYYYLFRGYRGTPGAQHEVIWSTSTPRSFLDNHKHYIMYTESPIVAWPGEVGQTLPSDLIDVRCIID